MDWGSLAGIALSLAGILAGQALEGGHLASLVQPAAFIIVIVGTAGAVLLQNGTANVLRGAKLGWQAFFPAAAAATAGVAVQQVQQWSNTARREGLLGLERYVEDVEDPFVKKGLRLIVDGFEAAQLRSILDHEISSWEMTQRQAARVWESAGGYAPTVGILGAVLGLIHVMENLSDPARLGSGIAVAFVATIYGVGLANLVFLPIGNKLKAGIAREVLQRDMLTDVFVCIASGDSSKMIAERMATYQR